jgi:hypothetical protein
MTYISSKRAAFTVKGIIFDDVEGWIEGEQTIEQEVFI